MKVGVFLILVPAAYVSSPMNSNEGYLTRSLAAIKVSTAWSVSVTISAAMNTIVSAKKISGGSGFNSRMIPLGAVWLTTKQCH